MKHGALFFLLGGSLLACATGDTVGFGEGGGGSGGAPATTSTKASATTGANTSAVTSGSSSTSSSSATSVSASSSVATSSASVATVSASSGMTGCDPLFEIDCGDGTCVFIFFLCDGFNDCANGSDEDPLLCTSNVPPEWTCDASYYDALDGCDCGCGAVDPDCGGTSSALCDYCWCGTGDCLEVDPADNSQCL